MRPCEKTKWKLRESLRFTRNRTNDYVRSAIRDFYRIPTNDVEALKDLSTIQLENSKFECKDARPEKRYTSDLIIKAIRYAFFRVGVTSPIGLGEDTRALFEPVTEFMLVSIYATIH